MDQWRCGECGALNDRVLDVCWHCGDEREYALSAKQGRAIARRLNGLEVENRALSAMLTASTLFVARTGRLLKEAWEEVKVWQDLHATSFDDAARLAREVERLRAELREIERVEDESEHLAALRRDQI